MRIRWCTLLVVVGSMMLFAVPAQAATATGWTLSDTQAVGSQSQFNATAALSASDVWAVGTSGLPDFNSSPLIEHWDGSQWSVTPSPVPQGAVAVNLLGVSGDASNDVWAVGRSSSGGVAEPLAMHWNGSRWRLANTPGLPDGAVFQAVSARARNDVWVVGNEGFNTLIEHWDGHHWSIVPSPNKQNGGDLQGVTALSGSDVWAVGSYEDATFTTRSLVQHWDGNAWSIVASPDTGAFSALTAVSAVSPSDIWAVGHSFPSGVATLAEHWDGNSWSVVPGPSVDVSQFNGVTAISQNNVLAVGSAIGDNGDVQTLAEQWDGTQWVVSPTPNVGSTSNLSAITATANTIFAVGDRQVTDFDTPTPLAESFQP